MYNNISNIVTEHYTDCYDSAVEFYEDYLEDYVNPIKEAYSFIMTLAFSIFLTSIVIFIFIVLPLLILFHIPCDSL